MICNIISFYLKTYTHNTQENPRKLPTRKWHERKRKEIEKVLFALQIGILFIIFLHGLPEKHQYLLLKGRSKAMVDACSDYVFIALISLETAGLSDKSAPATWFSKVSQFNENMKVLEKKRAEKNISKDVR